MTTDIIDSPRPVVRSRRATAVPYFLSSSYGPPE